MLDMSLLGTDGYRDDGTLAHGFAFACRAQPSLWELSDVLNDVMSAVRT